MRRLGSAGLGYGQVVFLVLGFLIASGLIFLFGIWVGRDVTERRLAREERVVRLPMPARPTPSEEAPERAVDATFYERLKEKAQRLQETAAAGSPTAGRVAQVAAPTATPLRVAQKATPAPTATARRKPSPQPSPRATESREESMAAAWTVQVNATTNVHQALDIARSLKSRGYDAYTVQVPTGGHVWYRVRVGRFSSRDKAKELENRLRTTEGFENAYVTPQ